MPTFLPAPKRLRPAESLVLPGLVAGPFHAPSPAPPPPSTASAAITAGSQQCSFKPSFTTSVNFASKTPVIPKSSQHKSNNGNQVQVKTLGTSRAPKAPVAPLSDEEAAALDKLNGWKKTNTAQLLDFLRRRGVPCRSKDKKDELVRKVQEHLRLREY